MQTFPYNKLEPLMELGVKCNISGLDIFFNNPNNIKLIIKVYPDAMGGGISFTVSTIESNKYITQHCKAGYGIGWGTYENPKLNKHAELAKWIYKCCPSLADVGLTIRGNHIC